jgi:TatD DNase family protein
MNPLVLLTDTHCHLNLEHFAANREQVIQHAMSQGVIRMLIPALDLASSRSIVDLVSSEPSLYAAIGVHPTEALSWTETTKQELRALFSSDSSRDSFFHTQVEPSGSPGKRKIVAIGEIGLDYYWDSAPHERQQFVLREQLNLGAELGLPVIIHIREKDDSNQGPCAQHALDILTDWVSGLQESQPELAQRPGVLHSFSGTSEIALRALALNFFIGISGPVTYKNAQYKQDLVSKLPLERLLIETDSPFLAPHPHRGKRNEPAYVAEIADKIAQLQSRNLEDVAKVTTTNAARLFSWGETV